MTSFQENKKDRGAVLLTTLLVLAIMAALAVALMDDIRLALKRTANVSDYAQADWYVRGAEDYVAEVLAERLAGIENNTALNQIIASINPIVLPIEGGVMQLNVRDGSHCFNLGSLTGLEGQINEEAAQQLGDTLEALGLPTREVDLLKVRVLDWIDKDNQTRPGGAEDGDYLRRTPQILPANTALASVMELNALEGMTPELYNAIRPWFCIGALNASNQFNINLAEPWQAPLLAGLMGGSESLSVALQLIIERPPQGYSDPEAILNTVLVNDLPESENTTAIVNAINNHIIFSPETLWVELELSYRKAQRSRSFYFTDIKNAPPKLIYRGWGRESFRPDLTPLDETNSGANSSLRQNERP